MVRLSVNINKIATLRNSRGGSNPNLLQVAMHCEQFGAQGITVHPRPDERHIRYQDVVDLKKIVTTELNVEGYPDKRYMDLMEHVRPTQATLVPDPPDALTSNTGWDTISQYDFLKEIIQQLKTWGIRTSIFVNPEEKYIEGASRVETHRIELYTEPYAVNYFLNKEKAVQPYKTAAELAGRLSIGVNAGHDLSLHNLRYLKQNLPQLAEVSIGHALICDALYLGLENTIQLYLKQLE
jgi:pyridoxine 5-phosphate synthase